MVVVGLQDGTLTTLTYDATGMRRESQAGAAMTSFRWDARNVLLETDGGGTTQAAYTHGAGTYGPLIAQRRAGSSIFHHFDALGSTTELTSATAAVTDTYRYYAFGETRASTGSTTSPFRLVGKAGEGGRDDPSIPRLAERESRMRNGRVLSGGSVGGRRCMQAARDSGEKYGGGKASYRVGPTTGQLGPGRDLLQRTWSRRSSSFGQVSARGGKLPPAYVSSSAAFSPIRALVARLWDGPSVVRYTSRGGGLCRVCL